MATIRHHVHIDRRPDEVWKVVADAAAIAAWFPGIESVRMEGNRRHCALGPGLELVEEVVTVDDDLRRFQYRIVGGPLSVSSHLATVDVLADGDGSLVVYSTDVSPDEVKDLIDPAIAAGVQGLKSHLEG
jgi:carbon monoxide dehydrogenase subunit G